MRVFKTAWFARAARKARIDDGALCAAVMEMIEMKSATKPRKFRTDAYEAVHSSARALFGVGAISKETMRNYDASCLVPPESLKPRQIKALRESNHVSQPVFARYLNTSESTVEKWETGAKRPSGAALKLLAVVQKYGLKILF